MSPTASRPTSAPSRSPTGGLLPGTTPGTRLREAVAGPAASLRTQLGRAAPALLAYAAVRLVGLLLLALRAHAEHHGVRAILATRWDANWYLGIARHGYAHRLGTAYDAGDLAFFPLYPYLVKAVAALTPGTLATAGLMVTVTASFLAAWGGSSPSATVSTDAAPPCC
ncbi:hypothetical protein ACWD7F_25035 [Streptomyces sp. NPDC005122]